MKSQVGKGPLYGSYKLFTPVKVGDYTVSHRVVLAPMTRLRANADDSPSDMMIKFYEQRAAQGNLLIVESSAVAFKARSYYGAPGMYDDGQIPAWKRLTAAVHAKGGIVFAQLFHGGRQSHVDMTGGVTPVGPSVLPFEGKALTKEGWQHSSPFRELGLKEIPEILGMFRQAAEKAKASGFDGVELHGANGYLADQFLQDGSNHRTDAYGGSIENRARLMLELADTLISVFGPGKVGVRISPNGEWGDVSDSNAEATFGYLAKELDKRGIAYLHVIEPRIKGDDTLHHGQDPVAAATIRKYFKGTILAAGGFDRTQAEKTLQAGDADIIAFGRFYSSNPDLPIRLKYGYPLTPYVRAAFWGGSEENYNDFLTYAQQEERVVKKLSGKVAVVTGGNSGIGLSVASLLAAEGASVAITGRTQQTIEEAVSVIGHNAIGIVSDVENVDNIEFQYKRIVKALGKIDVLVVNAGIYIPGLLADFAEADFDKISRVNFKGVFFSVQKALPYLNDGASVILTSSTLATMSVAGVSAYSATKAAVNSLAKAFSAELADRGIRVNVVSPGPVDTPIMTRDGASVEEYEGAKSFLASKTLAGRMGITDEVAEAFLYLASDAGKYILGSELLIDGGMRVKTA